MMTITDEIRKEVEDYLETEMEYCLAYPDDLYAFYYRCMMAGMHYADADRYAILNTLFNYDIGMENAREIDGWMYEHDEEIYELMATNMKHKALVALAVAELGLDIDFSGWIKEDYEEYKFFEN
jgi:phage anti-repressor protein